MHRIGTIDVFPGEMGNNHTLSISPDSVAHGKYSLLAISDADATMLEQTVEMIADLICQESPRAAAESIVARMAWRIAGRLESKNKQIATLCDPNGSAGAWMDDRSIAEDALAAVINDKGAKCEELKDLLDLGTLRGIDEFRDGREMFWESFEFSSPLEWPERVVDNLSPTISVAIRDGIEKPDGE